MTEGHDSSRDYLREHAAKSNYHIAEAFNRRADEMISSGVAEEHPAVKHLRDRASTFFSSPENN